MMPIMLNECFGNFEYSDKAINIFNDLHKDVPGFNPMNKHSRRRTNLTMINICKELGEEANGEHSSLVIKYFPEKYINHYYIDEYRGLEHVVILFEKYILDTIAQVTNSSIISDTDKIIEINKILKLKLEEFEI